jgi:sugar transferase EpsL
MFKSFLDRILAAVALLVLWPEFLILFLLARLRMGTPVIFRQKRIGWREQPFIFLKFRTMTDQRDDSGQLLPDAKRLTELGKIMRDNSLDELPQLWSVLKGDMSLVGPRPLLPEYLPRYSAFQRRRHEVKPGITGWAQVNGRNELSWEEKFDLDVWYVDHHSFWLDLKIIGMTLYKVFARRGICHSGHATMPEFFGSPATKE